MSEVNWLLNPQLPEGPLEHKWDLHRSKLKLVSPNNKRKMRVIVVGTGLAGASAAASLAELGYHVDAFTFHDSPRRAHSIAAQGGINAAKNYQNDGDNVWRLFHDTIKGGDFRSREANVYRLAQVSNSIIDQCVAQGVPFAREYGGQLANRSFGGAQVSRTFYCRGQTGQQLLLGAYSALSRQVASGQVRAHAGIASAGRRGAGGACSSHGRPDGRREIRQLFKPRCVLCCLPQGNQPGLDRETESRDLAITIPANTNAITRNRKPELKLGGKNYWRSLDELADKPEFREWLEREFPNQASEWLGGTVSRRRALQLMAASFGFAGLAGCRRPDHPILPYAKTPEAVLPGLPTSYATTIPRPGSAFPVLVETQEGRPTKIEGNPLHPWSQGSTDLQAQAAVLDLYDPDRSREVMRAGQPSTWQAFDAFAEAKMSGLLTRRGQGLRILSEDVSSPALRLLREHVRQVLPEAVWHVHEAIGPERVEQGVALAFGKPLTPTYLFQNADVVVSLGSDFLGVADGAVANTRAFAERRKVEGNLTRMNRLYVVENHPTTTGGMADHRLRLPASQVQAYMLALSRELLLRTTQDQGSADPRWQLANTIGGVDNRDAFPPGWVREVATDLLAARGRSLILAGPQQPTLVHALAHLLNTELDNLGNTVLLRERPDERYKSLVELTEAMRRGEVETLVILGGNPVFDAAADLELVVALQRVPHTIRLGLYADETSAASTLHPCSARWPASVGYGH